MSIKRSSFLAFNKCALAIVTLALLVLANGKSATTSTNQTVVQTPAAQQRKTRIIKPPRVPLSISAVKNLEKDNWLEDIEIEIKNDSNKPIYYLSISLHFPDLPRSTEADGISRDYGMLLSYGRGNLLQSGRFATASDLAIPPGRTYTFKINEAYRKGLLSYLSKNNLSISVIKNIDIRIGSISFGDGTGYVGGAPTSFQRTSKILSPPPKAGGLEAKKVRLLIEDPNEPPLQPVEALLLQPKTINLFVNNTAEPQSSSCGPYQSGCGHYETVEETCPLPNTCTNRYYRGLITGGECLIITAYSYFNCVLPDETEFICTFDSAYECNEYLQCGGARCAEVLQDCFICIGSGKLWNTSDCTCGCDPIERQDCLNTQGSSGTKRHAPVKNLIRLFN
jgi:hypothetical protein